MKLPKQNVSPLLIGLLMAGCTAALTAQAQPSVDPGTLLNNVRPNIDRPIKPDAPLLVPEQRPLTNDESNVQFLVKSIQITGNQAIGSDELQAVVADSVGQIVSLRELQQLAGRITAYYKSKGFIAARAVLPAQEITDGKVEIRVLEGRLDKISVKSSKPSLKDLAVAMTSDSQPAGSAINLKKLERGLLLLNDLPGIEAKAAITAGESAGETSLLIEVSPVDAFEASFDLDQYGNRLTGETRGSVTAQINGGVGQSLLATVLHAESLDYGRIGADFRLGNAGLRGGLSISRLEYSLCCEFELLDSEGKADTVVLNAYYPLIRSRAENLFLGASVERRLLSSTVADVKISNKAISVADLTLSGDRLDLMGGGGQWAGSIGLVAGDLSLDNQSERQLDQATARSEGNYYKVQARLSRYQFLAPRWTTYWTLFGQASLSGNLDSSEKLTLSGHQGVRGYGEDLLTGDQGLIGQFELRYLMAPNVIIAGLADYGVLRLHVNEWAGARGADDKLENTESMASLGLDLRWTPTRNVQAVIGAASRIGPEPITLGPKDDDRIRLRAQLTARF